MTAPKYRARLAGGLNLSKNPGSIADQLTLARPYLERGDRVWFRNNQDENTVAELRVVDGALTAACTNRLGETKPAPSWVQALINTYHY